MVAPRTAASAFGLSLCVAVLSGCGSEPSAPTVHVQLELSRAIPTVGVLTWEADVAIDSATVEFGRSPGDYEYTAPVDVADPDQPVFLLGMKADTDYYARLVANHGGETLTSGELSITTGPVPNGLPGIEVNDLRRDDVYGGFSISCNLSTEGYAFIYDADGDYVWWHALLGTSVEGCSRARLSFDGKYVWIGNLNNLGSEGALLRVTVDGLHSESYSLPGRHHDFAVLPNDDILYFERKSGGGADGSEGPDVIKELDPETGDSQELYDQSTDFSDAESGAHTNYITYVPELEAISFSMRSLNTIGVISYPNPELMLVFGGSESDFDISWNVQHGHQLTDDSLLLFNNEADVSGSTPGASSAVVEYRYDAEAREAEKVLEYAPGNTSFVMGDVQRLPNGNTLVTFSTQGVIHEIDADGELLREISTDPVGYVQQQESLYGPPPPFLTE